MKQAKRAAVALTIVAMLGLSVGQAQEVDSDGDGIGDSAEVLLGTNPQNPDTDGDGLDDLVDTAPTRVESAPQLSTGKEGFTISDVLVENNYDAVAKKDAADHLEVSLKNVGQQPVGNLSVYYTIKDLKTAAEQSYLLPLTDFRVLPSETKPINIDITGETGHFGANPNSLYYTSQNEMQIEVTVMAEGYQAATLGIKKDAGGAETAD